MLTDRAKALYLIILLTQTFISAVDLIGLAIIMKIVLGLQGSSNRVGGFSTNSIPFIGDLLSSLETGTLLLYVVVIFIVKGFIALLLHTLNVRIMATETEHLVQKVSATVFENRTNTYQHFTSQDITYAIFNATETVYRDTLVPFSIIVADSFLLLLVSINLYFNVQSIFFPTVAYFLIVSILLRRAEKKVTKAAYLAEWQSEVRVHREILEVFSSLRELYVSNTLNSYLSKINKSRSEGIQAGAVVSIANLRPKYFYEISLFGGIGLIALVSNLTGNRQLLLTNLAMFLVSSSRMIPSLLRMQYCLGLFQKAAEQSSKIFEILSSKIIDEDTKLNNVDNKKGIRTEFTPKISMRNVEFRYGVESEYPTISGLNLEIHPGETVAIVGPSGAGKSTLVDLMLGYQLPNLGRIEISGAEPRASFKNWPGSVAYVPQKVTIYEGSLLENVGSGTENSLLANNREYISNLLDGVGLGEYISTLSDGLDSQLSEYGSNLSGGQIQRIGIARALYFNPQIIVFDESTSSLDSISEKEIMEFLLSFKGNKTLVFIAHRLSTIKTVDRVLFLKDGQIAAEGTFNELRTNYSEFNELVELQKFGVE